MTILRVFRILACFAFTLVLTSPIIATPRLQQDLNCADFKGNIALANVDDTTLSATVRAEILSACGHSWAVDLPRGGTITIALNGAWVGVDPTFLDDPILYLYDNFGNLLAQNDDTSGSRNSFINTTLSSGGTYRILAMGLGGTTGGYELTVTANLVAIICGLNNAEFQNYIGVTNIDDLTTSGTVHGDITSACGHQWGIQADRASSFSISLVGISTVDRMALYDPYLLFYDANGNLIAENDDASGSLNSYIQTGLRNAGVYYIVARDVRENYGSYELTVTLVREPEPVVMQAVVVQPIVVQPEAVQPVAVQPAVVRQADLRFDDISYDINPDNRECTISFTITNEGNASANNFKVQSDSPRGWTDTTKVLSLGVNRTVSRTMTITFPNNAWDSTVDITLDIEDSVESDYDNNSATISIRVPSLPDQPANNAPVTNNNVTTSNEQPQDLTAPRTNTATPIMTNEGVGESDNSMMIVVMIIGAIGIGGASVWVIARPRLITPDRDTRRYWQDRATRNHPINPCQTGNSWCEMSKVEPQYNRYEIKSLDVLALPNLIDSPCAQYEASNEVLKLLNRELIMTHTDLEWEKLRGRMKDVARMLLYEVSNWLAYQSAIYFIAFYANIEGSEVEFEFTLYQCPLNSWLQEVNWTAKSTDTRKLPIITLTNTINTPDYDQLVGQLANGLVEMFRVI